LCQPNGFFLPLEPMQTLSGVWLMEKRILFAVA
jgi:hypothetical protein